MVIATKGVMLECDATIQQFVIHVNESKPANERFIIAILDPTHLFVKEDAIPDLKRRLDELMNENTAEPRETS